MQSTEDARVGEELGGVGFAFLGEPGGVAGSVRHAGFVVDDPETIGAAVRRIEDGERGWPGTEDAVGAERAEAGVLLPAMGIAGPGGLGLGFGVGGENPLTNGVGSTGQEKAGGGFGGGSEVRSAESGGTEKGRDKGAQAGGIGGGQFGTEALQERVYRGADEASLARALGAAELRCGGAGEGVHYRDPGGFRGRRRVERENQAARAAGRERIGDGGHLADHNRCGKGDEVVRGWLGGGRGRCDERGLESFKSALQGGPCGLQKTAGGRADTFG